jgi:peptide/nickel transport system ATP-binding protein
MLKISNLSSYYKIKSSKWFRKDIIKAVEDVSLEIPDGKTLGLVGESGCGKSSLGRAILNLQPINSGSIFYKDLEISNLSKKNFFPLRKKLQIIFQDPYSSLNPRMTIEEIILEGLNIHSNVSTTEKKNKLLSILEKMNLKEDTLSKYPHEFSGGQRQRISIARTLILEPEFIVCDEIVSALDVSNQAQVLNLLEEYKESNQLSMLFISHDLNVIGYISDFIAVMYLGKIVEYGTKMEIIKKSKHPYTKSLFDSTFQLNKSKKNQKVLQGEIPSILNKPSGCYFHSRCPIAKDICKTETPIKKKISETQYSFCHFS